MMSVPAGLPRPALSALQLVCIKYAPKKRVAVTAFRKKEPENAGRIARAPGLLDGVRWCGIPMSSSKAVNSIARAYKQKI